MSFTSVGRFACVSVVLGVALQANADSFTSSASSAGSASVGSISGSLHGSSKSSTDGEKAASGDYRIVEVATAPDRAGAARVTMQADDPRQQIVLDLPQAVVEKQRLRRGDLVHAQRRVYGFEFARVDTRQAFYLALADDWYDELAARPVRF